MVDKDRWRGRWVMPEIEHMVPTKWGWVVWHPKNLKLGWFTDIGYGTVIHAHAGVEIDYGVQIGPGCAIISKDTISGKEGSITLKRDAKIGANSVVMPGCSVGISSVIGACSLLLANTVVPDGETWFGIPAKKYHAHGKYYLGYCECKDCQQGFVAPTQ